MLIEHPNAQLIDHINIIIILEYERKYSDDSHRLLMTFKEHIINNISQDKSYKSHESTGIYFWKV